MLENNIPKSILSTFTLRFGRISLRCNDLERVERIADHVFRLENLIREALAAEDHNRIAKIVHQLCEDYAYAVHQPHARNGGLIGLAAAAIALGGVNNQFSQMKTPLLSTLL